jgi:hypothetical protein
VLEKSFFSNNQTRCKTTGVKARREEWGWVKRREKGYGKTICTQTELVTALI